MRISRCAIMVLALLGGCVTLNPKDLAVQSRCPVTGMQINRDHYVDTAGARIYLCSADCAEVVKADPGKYIKFLMDRGEKVQTRLIVCGVCGEIKGSKRCCARGAEKCPKCGLNKGSIGCCRDLKPAAGEKDVVLCPKCGEVQGGASCCITDAARCPRCGLNAGSPGCCKLKAGCPCGTAGVAKVCGCSKESGASGP